MKDLALRIYCEVLLCHCQCVQPIFICSDLLCIFYLFLLSGLFNCPKFTYESYPFLFSIPFQRLLEKVPVDSDLFRSAFMSGQALSPSMLDTLLYQSFVKPYIMSIVYLLIGLKQHSGSGHLIFVSNPVETSCYRRLLENLDLWKSWLKLPLHSQKCSFFLDESLFGEFDLKYHILEHFLRQFFVYKLVL